MAVMAKALNKPFYVVAECFKFVRLYPLKQEDIRNVEKVSKKKPPSNRPCPIPRTVKPPNNSQAWGRHFGPCREVGPSWRF